MDEGLGFGGGGRSLWLWGLCHQEACSLLHLWHHCSIPFHRAGTTETPIKLLISCSPSLAHSRLPLYSNTRRILNPCSQIGSRFPAPDKPIIFFLCYCFTLGEAANTTQQLLSRLLQIWARGPLLSPLRTPVHVAPLAQSHLQRSRTVTEWDEVKHNRTYRHSDSDSMK